MKTLSEFATVEDIISAFELIYEQDNVEIMTSNIFGLNNTLSLINFACIKDTDKVITIASHLELITWSISYIYTPEKLVTNAVNPSCKIDEKRCGRINELLSGYNHTTPVFSEIQINCIEPEEEPYDAAIVGFIDTNNLTDAPIGRFTLETGIEFDIFEMLLIKSSNLLKENGILVILTKPAWILKLWSLVDSLGLQLEYDQYKLYADTDRHPNVYIWLRFVKRVKNVDWKLHNKNILSLMKDNGIDRLYAHRNNLRFPYVELSFNNTEAYVNLNQNLEYMQYFFSLETTMNLAKLCVGYTACLVTPSVAQCSHKLGKNIVLFERDNRFRENGGLRFVKYDLNIGLTKLLQNKYMKKFDRVICDPPFDIKLDVLASDIVELLKEVPGSTAYVVFPASRKVSLVNAMKTKGLIFIEDIDKLCIEYAKPPKIVRVHGKDAIQLHKFTYIIK